MRGISWLAANQLASQEGLCTMEYVSTTITTTTANNNNVTKFNSCNLKTCVTQQGADVSTHWWWNRNVETCRSVNYTRKHVCDNSSLTLIVHLYVYNRKIKRGGQCTCKGNIEARSLNHCYRRKAISITYFGCVSVALGIHHPAGCAIFSHVIS